ncbi:quinoprotein relay system zinc metallohydrolase 2 [Rhodovulum sp. ES.010]|uniref:quinoprotein relay system zinc metallohydrolase 2 n=1 Tax=Rhodovulum sp. ES.010 TaxID=1882821 RepID=UPI0009280179|nr:quinoprotein relay system zinc metallohydrolase 2 [Rhodovulum sp. ES.010]SIO47346.1 quinoprotein relay system zinc metallohydrolase 2 [Rhodovulum sp. ES.010]
MFEAVVTLCLAAALETCRPVLLPGYEAAGRDACVAALAARPPDGGGAAGGLVAQGEPTCRPAGPALALSEAAPGLWVHRGVLAEPDRANGADVANLAVIVGTRSVAVIDTGGARAVGEALWRAVRAQTDLPVSHVILTHMHPDHLFGAAPFVEAGAQVVAHEALARALADRQANYLESFARLIGPDALIGTAAPAVDVAVAETATIDLGDRELDLRAWPPAHTGNDLTAFDRASGTLIAGDLVFDRHVPALDGSLRGWQAVLGEMRQMPAARVVPGHGGPVLPWPQGGADTARYLDVLAGDTRAAIAEGARLGAAVDGIARSERDRWELFEAFNARNATVAFTELEWE